MKKIGEGLNYRKRGQDEGGMTVMMSEKVIKNRIIIYLSKITYKSMFVQIHSLKFSHLG